MKIRMKISINGTFHNIDGGVKVGDVVDIDEQSAANYVASGYAEAIKPGGQLSEEHAVQQFSDEERAVLDTEIIGASNKPIPQPRTPRPPKVEPEPEPEPELEPKAVTKVDAPATKPGPRATRRTR
jgi:hypothetical protein